MSNLKPRRFRRSQRGRGQALTEFALVVPIFLLLVAGMIDFGLGLNASITVTNAARGGARLGATTLFNNTDASTSVGHPLGNIAQQVKAMAVGLDSSQFVAGTNPVITCITPGGTVTNCVSTAPAAGDTVKVSVTYSYRMIWPLAFGNVISLPSSAQFRIE
jgi:Flp pilus assembly protein TadG